MAKNNFNLNGALLQSMLQQSSRNKHKNKLDRYKEFMSTMQKNSQPSILGGLVQALIIKKLMKNAQREEAKNISNNLKVVEAFARIQEKKKEAEARAMQEDALRRELAKESRQENRELAKEKRNLIADITKSQAIHKIGDTFTKAKEVREATAKSFANPADALVYLQDPEKMEKNRETYDASRVSHKILGRVKEYFGGEKYQPQKVASRFKKGTI